MYVLTGQPGDITNISPDAITGCSFVVKWNRPYSDSVCGTIVYTIIISTKEGMIITDTTTMNNYYNANGLNSSTVYSVNVTASNNAGSNDPTVISVMTSNSIAIGKILLHHYTVLVLEQIVFFTITSKCSNIFGTCTYENL